MDVNRRKNYYSCRGFGHLVRSRNQGIIGQGRRIGYEDNLNIMNNLKEKES